MILAFGLAGKLTVPKQELKPDVPLAQKVGMFARSDTPIGNKTPLIDIDLKLYHKQAARNGTDPLAEFLVFHHTMRSKVGKRNAYGLSDYCCTRDNVDAGNCDISQLGRLIFDPSLNTNGTDPLVFYTARLVPRDPLFAELTINYEPKKSGYWYFFLANCDQEINTPITFEGHSNWLNPYGWLPGQAYGYLVLYFVVGSFTAVVLLLWVVWLIRFHEGMHVMQHLTSAILVIGTVEMFLWGFEFVDYNYNGFNNLVLAGFAVFFSCTKYTLIRAMVLLIALGYKITRETLFLIEWVVGAVLLLFYFVVAAAQQYVQLSEIDGVVIAEWAPVLVGFFLAVFSIVIVLWIIIATAKRFQETKKSQSEKFKMYLYLFVLFIIIAIISFILFIAQLGLEFFGTADFAMGWMWLIEGYWDLIYLVLIAYAAFIWRPAPNNQRYAYQPLADHDPEDANAVELEDA